MRLVLSQRHKDYEIRLLQAASGYECHSACNIGSDAILVQLLLRAD
jgi:hypothetical protein